MALFYQGSLQEGISTAVGQQKLVFCFVTNDDDESQTWERDYLQTPPLEPLIRSRAVALRLQAGSDEAQYLSQIFPLPQTPTVVIMKHGELKEYIAAGTSRAEFVRRVQTAFSVAPPPSSDPPSSPSPAASSPPTPARSHTVDQLLAERAARLEAQRAEDERKAREDGAKSPAAAAEGQSPTGASATNPQADLFKKRRQQAAEERRRILRRIEDDRQERRHRAVEQGLRRKCGDGAAAPAPASEQPSTTQPGPMASIQVRLLDGSTIRSRFTSTTSLSQVRSWVDKDQAKAPSAYTFKQLLTPKPSRAIDETEEGKTLDELDLAPSSTLILVPVTKSAAAYDATAGLRPALWLSRLAALMTGLLAWLMGLLGFATDPARRPPRAVPGADDGEERRRRQRLQQEQQLYNGNSLNFEPQPDEDAK